MELEVEKILKIRFDLNQDEPQYRLKWLNLGSKENSWEPKSNLNCPDLLIEFEKKRRGTILGAQRRNNELFFLIKFVDVKNVEEVPACDANECWPQMVIQFYEKRLKWIITAAQHTNGNANPAEDANINENEEPEAVLYATDANGELLLWMQWKSVGQGASGPCKFVTAKEANKKWPKIVIHFYENNIALD